MDHKVITAGLVTNVREGFMPRRPSFNKNAVQERTIDPDGVQLHGAKSKAPLGNVGNYEYVFQPMKPTEVSFKDIFKERVSIPQLANRMPWLTQRPGQVPTTQAINQPMRPIGGPPGQPENQFLEPLPIIEETGAYGEEVKVETETVEALKTNDLGKGPVNENDEYVSSASTTVNLDQIAEHVMPVFKTDPSVRVDSTEPARWVDKAKGRLNELINEEYDAVLTAFGRTDKVGAAAASNSLNPTTKRLARQRARQRLAEQEMKSSGRPMRVAKTRANYRIIDQMEREF